jgi:ribonuclease inhibitor
MELIIDGNEFYSIDAIHSFLMRRLELPDYYGGTLDSLWDCLTSWVEMPLTIKWTNFVISRNRIGGGAEKMIDLFSEAEKEIDGFTFVRID